MIRKLYFKNQKYMLSGIFNIPKKRGKLPAIILPHGYGVTKDKACYKKIAYELENQGYVVFRFDFTGCGESQGPRETNIEQQVIDMRHAIDFVAKQTFVDNKRIAVIGNSFSGLVSLITLAGYKKIRTYVSVNSVFDLRELVGERWIPVIRFFDEKGIRIYSGIYKSLKYLEQINLAEIAKKVKIPTLVIHGVSDKKVPYTHSLRLYNLLECKKELKLIEKGNHNFSNASGKIAFNSVLEWLEEHLTDQPRKKKLFIEKSKAET